MYICIYLHQKLHIYKFQHIRYCRVIKKRPVYLEIEYPPHPQLTYTLGSVPLRFFLGSGLVSMCVHDCTYVSFLFKSPISPYKRPVSLKMSVTFLQKSHLYQSAVLSHVRTLE